MDGLDLGRISQNRAGTISIPKILNGVLKKGTLFQLGIKMLLMQILAYCMQIT